MGFNPFLALRVANVLALAEKYNILFQDALIRKKNLTKFVT